MRYELGLVGHVYFEIHLPADSPLPGSGLAPGEERFISKPGIELSLGGVLNVAATARHLGAQTHLWFPASDEGVSERGIEAALSALGIDFKRLPAKKDPAISVVFESFADRSFLSSADFEGFKGLQGLADCQWIHVPGLKEAYALTGALQEARANGCKVSVSGSWCSELLQLRSWARDWDLLVMNDAEARRATDEKEMEKALEKLEFVARDRVITLGKHGAIGSFGGELIRSEALPVEVKGSTGAGDAFCAGLLTAIAKGVEPKQAMEIGAEAASLILQQRSGVPDDPVPFRELGKRAGLSRSS